MPLRLAEGSDRARRPSAERARPERLLAADGFVERRELAHQESTKPPLRPLGPPPQTSASIEHDVERRVVLLQRDRGPETRVAAAHDADVGALARPRAGRAVLAGERLVEPEAPCPARPRRRPSAPTTLQVRSASDSRLARLCPLAKTSTYGSARPCRARAARSAGSSFSGFSQTTRWASREGAPSARRAAPGRRRRGRPSRSRPPRRGRAAWPCRRGSALSDSPMRVPPSQSNDLGGRRAQRLVGRRSTQRPRQPGQPGAEAERLPARVGAQRGVGEHQQARASTAAIEPETSRNSTSRRRRRRRSRQCARPARRRCGTRGGASAQVGRAALRAACAAACAGVRHGEPHPRHQLRPAAASSSWRAAREALVLQQLDRAGEQRAPARPRAALGRLLRLAAARPARTCMAAAAGLGGASAARRRSAGRRGRRPGCPRAGRRACARPAQYRSSGASSAAAWQKSMIRAGADRRAPSRRSARPNATRRRSASVSPSQQLGQRPARPAAGRRGS